jgi:phosphotransferase family enzyme
MKLDLRTIIPSPASGAILLTADGTLPAAVVEGDADEAAVVAATAWLRDTLAFRAPILETHPRWANVPDGAAIPTLVLTEPAPARWEPPEGLGFGPIPDGTAGLAPALVPRAVALLDELRTGAEPPALRPRWARRGWQARASAWMIAASAAAGRPLVDEPRPFYLRGISALLRGSTATGDLFLKAVFPPFHSEPAITELLAAGHPESVPRVVATEPDEGWLLVEDAAAPLIGELPPDTRPAGLEAGARTLVTLQRAIGEDIAAFIAAGAPRRPLTELPDAIDAVLGPEGVAIIEGPLAPERHARVLAATWKAVERVAGLGFPATLVHGDFHPGNALLTHNGVVIIDWSDAAISNPIVDLVTWLDWSRDEPEQQRVATDAWVDAWAGPTDPVAIREALDDVLVVGAAYQVVSYEGIIRALEPATRYTMGGGASHFLGRLEGILDRAAAGEPQT